MILLQSSKNFRKIGLALSIINIILQAFCFLLIAVFYGRISDFLVIEERVNHYYTTIRRPFANIAVVALIFFAIDFVLYLWVIFGLLKRRPGFLQAWLIYSIVEFLIIEIFLFFTTIGSCVYFNLVTSIFSLLIQILVSVHLYHNICVIYSAYNQFVKAKLPPAPQVNPNVMSSPPVQPVQYTMPQYVAPQAHYAPTATAPTVSYPSHMVPDYDYSKPQPPPTYTA